MKLPFVSLPTLRALGRALNGHVPKEGDREALSDLRSDINQLEYELSAIDAAQAKAREEAGK